MKNLSALLACFFISLLAGAQSFNGSIEFKYLTQKDTTTNMYLVKEKVVKLDQFAKKGGLEGSFIFDLGTNKIKWVNPKRKVWGELKSETPPVIRGTCEVSKGGNTKTVMGVKCREYIVKNSEENTSITYWMADNKYDFFMPLLRMWNHKDRQSIYFNQIKDLPAGSMPLLSEEKQLSDGKLITRLEVTKINPKAPDEVSMGVPAGYTKLD